MLFRSLTLCTVGKPRIHSFVSYGDTLPKGRECPAMNFSLKSGWKIILKIFNIIRFIDDFTDFVQPNKPYKKIIHTNDKYSISILLEEID